MPTPTIPAGNLFMNATLWSGDSTSSRSIANTVNGVSFQPDFVWLKNRTTSGYSHQLTNSVVGAPAMLQSDTTNAQATSDANGLQSAFTSTGFTLSNGGGNVNLSGQNYVAWQWKESVSAGFDIVTYTGNGTSQWVNHSLGVAPQMIIIKSSSTVTNWIVYQAYTNAVPYNYYLQLNTTSAAINSGSFMGANPTSTQFNVGSLGDVNNSGSTFVAYCWAPIAGYSAFGSYTGNGSTDGTFVYLGFRPRFVIIKSSTFAGADWVMYDSARNTYNALTSELSPNSSASENNYGGAARMDFVSNGIKMRTAGAGLNNSGDTYIYMAFAENPLKFANAR